MKRERALGMALVAALAASGGVALLPEASQEAPVVPPVTRPAPPPLAAAAPASSPDVPAGPLRQPWPQVDAGALAAWSPPAAAPPAPVASPPPSPESLRPRAPAFPYQWIGRLEQDGTATAMLDGAHRSFGARAGDVLDGQWRIDRVGASRLEITWLPTEQPLAVPAR